MESARSLAPRCGHLQPFPKIFEPQDASSRNKHLNWCVSEPCLEFERLILPPAKPFLSPSSAGPGLAVKVVVAIMSGRSSLKLGTAVESSRKLVLEALGVERARVFFRPPLT